MDLELRGELPPEGAEPEKLRLSLKNILIQIAMTIVGLAMLASIVFGFMTVVRGAGTAQFTATPFRGVSKITLTVPPTTGPTRILAATPLPAASQTPIPPQQYTVKPGDTLLGISQKFDVPVKEILSLNDLSNSDILQIGQVLLIPAAGATAIPPTQPPAGPTPGTILHVVQPGETLLGIAQRYGVPMPTIQSVNKIADPEKLQAGQQLIIPVGPAATATGGPPPTATLLPKYSAPLLLSPLNNAQFEGNEMPILLEWAAPTLLRSNEAYIATLEQLDSDQPPATFKTKATSLRVPLEFYPTGANYAFRQFQWSVKIVRQLDVQGSSEPVYEDASLPGETRLFTWLKPPPTPTPTPGPTT
jgi:LysM repeat protein